MARYRARIRSSWTPARALAYMADFGNAAEWDPGVRSARPVIGDGRPAYDLLVHAAGRDLPMRYVETERSRTSVVLASETGLLRSRDRITVEPAEGGCVVDYDADLRLRGAAAVLEPLLGVAFRRAAGRAHRSLERRLA